MSDEDFLDFDSDPELKKLKDAFVESLKLRLTEFSEFEKQKNWTWLRDVAHKLAGTGPSYGFMALGEITAPIDDYLTPFVKEKKAGLDPTRALKFAAYLKRALEKISASGKDCPELVQEPDFKALFPKP